MELAANRGSTRAHDRADVLELGHGPMALLHALLDTETRLQGRIGAAAPSRRASARNLAHHLELRRHDLRPLQERLARLGLSSPGRAETHVLSNLDKVLALLNAVAGCRWDNAEADEPCGAGHQLFDRHAESSFGPAPVQRHVCLMMTLPSEAARQPASGAAPSRC